MANPRSKVEKFATSITATGSAIRIDNGGLYRISVQASNFNGATIKLQQLGADGATYQDILTASWTATALVDINMPAGAQVRCAISVAVPVAVYVWGWLID